jgi:hypothetical protein
VLYDWRCKDCDMGMGLGSGLGVRLAPAGFGFLVLSERVVLGMRVRDSIIRDWSLSSETRRCYTTGITKSRIKLKRVVISSIYVCLAPMFRVIAE